MSETPVRLRDRPTALYHLYDARRRLLYIGIAVNLERRWEAHRRASGWWPEVTDKVVVWFPDRVQASAAEVKAIESMHPIHNKSRIPAVRPADAPKTSKFSIYLSDDMLARTKASGMSRVDLIRRGLEITEEARAARMTVEELLAQQQEAMIRRVIREELGGAAAGLAPDGTGAPLAGVPAVLQRTLHVACDA